MVVCIPGLLWGAMKAWIVLYWIAAFVQYQSLYAYMDPVTTFAAIGPIRVLEVERHLSKSISMKKIMDTISNVERIDPRSINIVCRLFSFIESIFESKIRTGRVFRAGRAFIVILVSDTLFPLEKDN